MNFERKEIAWTSDGSGNYTEAVNISGVILRVVTNPGSAAPTDNYDVTLIDEDGIDLLASQGLNRDTTTTENFCPGLSFSDGTTTSIIPMFHCGVATLTIANAGDSKTGAVVLYIQSADTVHRSN
jgi:hypothetical protein